MADAKYVFMKIVAPLMGFLIANVMFFSGVPGFLERKRLGELGDFNPLPYPVILANCASWIAYSLYIDDYFLFFANAPGMLVGVYFTMVGYGLSPYGGKTRDAIERWTVGLVGALLALTLYVGLVAKKESDGHKQTTIGLFCNAVLLVYYASLVCTGFRLNRSMGYVYLFVYGLFVTYSVVGVWWMDIYDLRRDK